MLTVWGHDVRMLRMWLVGMVTVTVAGCHGLSTDFPDPQAGMRFANDDMARKSSASSERVDVPFQLKPTGTDGTELVIEFLQAVEPRGAKYISDVSVALQLVYKGVPVECVSTIRVEANGPAKSAETWRAELDERWAIDRVQECNRQHAAAAAASPEAGADAGSSSGYQADFGDSTSDGAVPDCTLDPHDRFDKRFEHFVAAKFTRPDLAKVTKQFSDLKLVETAPACHRIERVVHQHIAANLYFMGGVNRTDSAPSQPMGNYH